MVKVARKLSCGELLTIVGVVISIPGLLLGYFAYNRQFGYSPVPVRLAGARFSEEASFMRSSMFGTKMIGLKSLDELIRWNPAVVVELPTDRPLEELRLEVTPSDSFIDVRENLGEADMKPTPWVLESNIAKEYPITARPHAGDKVTIRVADLLVRLMVQGQVKEPERRKRHHDSKFLVKVFAKSAGSPIWNEVDDNRAIAFMFYWIPDGFPDEKCNEFGKKFNQPLIIEPD